MTMDIAYEPEKVAEIIGSLPEEAPGVVRVWKVVWERWRSARSGWVSRFYHSRLAGYAEASSDLCKCTGMRVEYWAGFHAFKDKGEAVAYWGYIRKEAVISCLIDKDWITAIGKQGTQTIIVSSAIFAPTYPERDVKLDDFLRWREQSENAAASGAGNAVARAARHVPPPLSIYSSLKI